MRYIVKSIVDSIKGQRPSLDKQLRIRLSGFEDARIYSEVCNDICKRFNNILVTAKLSPEKYHDFLVKGANSAAIRALEGNDWVAYDKSLTYYRNLPQDKAQLIILMGTEAVDDQGGLSDLYYIDPSKIVTELNGNFSKLLGFRAEGADKNMCAVINKLYKDLFALVPLDICKLSDMIDKWGSIDSIAQFRELFYNALPEWGLCKDDPYALSDSSILRATKKNTLQANYDFVTRKMFGKMTNKQYQKYLENTDKYPTNTDPNAMSNDIPHFPPTWEGWSKQKLNGYNKFAPVLKEYIGGQNVAHNRADLLYTDFCIAQDVLKLRSKTTSPSPRPTKIIVHGSPLSAMTHAIYSVVGAKAESQFDGIKISIISAEIADAINPQLAEDEDTQLARAWRRVCFTAGGIFDFIRGHGIELDGTPLDITVDPENIFSPNAVNCNVEQGNVCVASASKKLSKVSFDISRCLNGKLLKESVTHCEWTFSLSDGWNRAFDGLCEYYEQWNDKAISGILPLFQIGNYELLIGAKSIEEFQDILENSALVCSFDILQFINKKGNSASASKWYAEFWKLGSAFIDFCRSIYEYGFFGDLMRIGDSKINAFIDCYVCLGKKIIESKFTSGMEWVFNSFIHAFAIEPNNDSVRMDAMQKNCIIPPFHPAILQKRVDQAVFLYDGCHEIMRNKTEKTSVHAIRLEIENLEEMSEIHEGLDIFPGKEKLFGTTKTFADYCICGNAQTNMRMLFEGVHKKEAVFDDDFHTASLKRLDDSSKMYLDVIKAYLKAMPNSSRNLSLTVVNPSDLQPIVAAVYNHIQTQKDTLEKNAVKNSDAQRITVHLHILVTPENKGGKNYLTYWVNTFFNEDENVDVKVYLNEWDSTNTLFRLLGHQTDVLFLQDVLRFESLDFKIDSASGAMQLNECRFPIVFKPIPVMKDSSKRRIELTQKQFSGSTIHSQVVAYAKNFDTYSFQKYTVIKSLSIDRERRDLILHLHEYANWVVCVDSGMDGALLRDNSDADKYAVIGFSTGKGRQGQYNLTITARATIIAAIQARLKSRLKHAFKWNDITTAKASNHCMEVAKHLDGVSLLSAINPRGYKINEFLAYILTSEKLKKSVTTEGVQVLIHLDSYMHWFAPEKTDDEDKKYRPDFLLVSAKLSNDKKIELDARIIECKLAQYSTSDGHKAKAREQIVYGINRLSMIFDPSSDSIRRRYWYAQLYRALSFAQITFSEDDNAFLEYTEYLHSILEGSFTIHWSGSVYGYWKDWNSEDEIVTNDSEDARIDYHDIPQQMIQKLLLGDNSAKVSFADVPDALPDEEPTEDNEENEECLDNEIEDEVEIIATAPEKDSDIPVVEVTPGTPETHSISGTVESTTPAEQVKTVEKMPPAEKTSLENVRVYIGKDRSGSKVYWEFGNPKMANRHLLITGTSGQGKTYSIQTMLKELSEKGIPGVIFDYTEGFRIDQLDPAFSEALAGKIDERIIYATGVPINPFVRQEIEISGKKMKEKAADVAQRIANIFTHVYKFGDQQFSAIYTACRAGIDQYGDAMNMQHFKEQLQHENNPAAKTVISKMAPFLDSAEFIPDPDFDWGKLTHSNGTVTIIQLTNFVREIQVIITEMMLWDAWHYNKKYGNKDTPFVVVLDEAQNLSHKASSPSAMILTEGRKFGWSAWFATQSLKVLDSDEIVRLQQSAFKLYFKPTDDEITTVAKSIDPASGASAWTNTIKGLRKGHAIVVGDRNRPDGHFGPVNPVVSSIASFEDRANETD